MKTHAFDLDGTLADTKEAVLRSYRAAGVEPPPDFWGRPSKEWLQDNLAHRRKNELYKQLAPLLIKIMPAFEIAKQNEKNCIVMTGASRSAAEVVLKSIGLKPVELHCGLTATEKVEILNKRQDPGIYYDDDLSTIVMVQEETSWETVLIL